MTVTVGGCTSLAGNTTVTVNPLPQIPSVLIIHPTCTVPTGTITVQQPLGAQYTYSVDGINFQSNPQFTRVTQAITH